MNPANQFLVYYTMHSFIDQSVRNPPLLMLPYDVCIQSWVASMNVGLHVI